MAAFPEQRREQFLERPLPSSEESERAILGAILLDNQLIAQAVEHLRPADFYVPRHRSIFSAMISLFEVSKKIDPILISEELKKEGSIEAIGGVSAITSLTLGLPHFTDVADYIAVVRGKSVMRNLIRTCNEITSEALEEEKEPQETLDHAEQLIFELTEMKERKGFEPIQPIAEDVVARIHEFREKGGGALTGLATGYRDIDGLTSGLQKGDLIILAARPSMGKTAFALNIAERAAMREQAVVAVFSLEMSKEQVVMRMLSSLASVDATRFRTGRIFDNEWARVAEAIARLGTTRLYIDDTPGITVLEMRAKLRRLFAEQKQVDLVVLDYLQLMSGTSRRVENRQQEVSQISRDLKALAKEFRVPVLALSQLSRAPEGRRPPIPLMSDLRESGSIEQDADVVAFIYREDYYKTDEEVPEDKKNMADIIIAKQRNGPTDTVQLAFLKQFTRFEDAYISDASTRLN